MKILVYERYSPNPRRSAWVHEGRIPPKFSDLGCINRMASYAGVEVQIPAVSASFPLVLLGTGTHVAEDGCALEVRVAPQLATFHFDIPQDVTDEEGQELYAHMVLQIDAFLAAVADWAEQDSAARHLDQ